MSILFIFLGCLTLYGKSKYFPPSFALYSEKLKVNPWIPKTVGYSLFVLSFLLLGRTFDWVTSGVIFFITFTFCLCALVVVLPINKGFSYVLGGMFLATIVMETFI